MDTSDCGDYGAGTITINGGYIRAYGDEYGAGIGGGDDTRGGTLNVNGGRVEAYGGTDAAGIGGGDDGDGADVTITGGVVIAKAGCNEDAGLAIGRGDGNGAYGSLTLGANNKLYSPSSSRTMNSFRAYFQLNGITAGSITSGARLFFGDSSEATSICPAEMTEMAERAGAGWYDLSGRKLSNSKWANGQLPKGVYIHNGNKIVIK